MITLVINLSKNILLQTICLLNVSYLLQIRITSHLCIWISVRYLEIELTYEQHGLELHRSPILSVFFFFFNSSKCYRTTWSSHDWLNPWMWNEYKGTIVRLCLDFWLLRELAFLTPTWFRGNCNIFTSSEKYYDKCI